MKKILLSLAVTAMALAAVAQAPVSYKKRPSLGLNFILKDMKTAMLIDQSSLSSVLSNHQWAQFKDMNPGISLSYISGLSEKVDFMANLAGSYVKYPFSYREGVTQPTDNKFLLESDANLNLKLLSDHYIVVPYVSVGIGASMYAGTYFAAYAPVGLGLQISLGEGTFVNSRIVYNTKVSPLATNNFTYTIGIVSPVKDKPVIVAAPPPPAPVPIPKDSDNDGIIDSNDKCPDVPGTAKYNGCPVPDTDGDGINDENDKCPSVKGLPKYDGCPIPDRDKDGVNDDEDKCPDVAGVVRYQGCPVPDRDKDGINDEEDKCPDVPGVKENNGCPLVKKEVQEKVDMDAQRVFFETNSAKLLAKSYEPLNHVVSVMNEDAALRLDIEGHTDITGSDAINIPLSKNRAKSVYDYLVSKGIDASRLSSEGYGSSKPRATNKTAAGRAQNRRVVMRLKY